MSVSIPDWMEVSDKKDHHGELSALERFVYDNEPADVGLEGAHTAKEFRDGLQAALEEVIAAHTRVICSGCKQEIDPDYCHCGGRVDQHNPMNDGHAPIPMGCQCGRAR